MFAVEEKSRVLEESDVMDVSIKLKSVLWSEWISDTFKSWLIYWPICQQTVNSGRFIFLVNKFGFKWQLRAPPQGPRKKYTKNVNYLIILCSFFYNCEIRNDLCILKYIVSHIEIWGGLGNWIKLFGLIVKFDKTKSLSKVHLLAFSRLLSDIYMEIYIYL